MATEPMSDISLPEHAVSPAATSPAENQVNGARPGVAQGQVTNVPAAEAPTMGETTNQIQPTETPAPSPERVKQSEVVVGGSTNLEIWLDPTTQELVKERLINRLQIIKSLGGGGRESPKERPLTTIDRVIQQLGPEAIRRLGEGNLTREDLALAVFALRDELLQKSLAAGIIVRDAKAIETTRLGKIPLFRRTVENTSLQTQLEKSTKRLSTEYTREIGFDQLTQNEIENDLVALNQLRTSVELSFYGRSLDDPLFNQDSIALYTAGRKTLSHFNNVVVDELTGEEGILKTRFGGKTFLELSQNDPIAATQALYEANQRALTQFAGEVNKDLLKAEKPEVDTALIERQAAKLETKPTPEDLQKLTTVRATATAEFNTATTELNTILSPVEAAQKTLAEKQLAFDKANNTFVRTSERLIPQIERLQERAELLYSSIQEPDPSLSPQQKAAMQQAIAVTAQSAARIEEAIKSYQDQLSQLLAQQIEAEAELNQQQENLTRLQTEAEEKGLEQAREIFRQKKAAKENAERELRERQGAAQKEIPPEAREQARGLRKWNEVARGYEQIINARYDQKYAQEYSRERLADITEGPDGRIKGAEKLIEHIFRVPLENKEDYDPELARKMTSYETLARAIIWANKLDPETISVNGRSLNQLLSNLKETKDTIRETPEDKDLQREKADQEKEIIKLVLPYLRSSQFKLGDLLRFTVHEGLKSAERGNPYLTLDEYYQTPAPELRLQAESIYREGLGNAEIDIEDNTVIWTGSVPNSTMPGLIRSDLPTSYRITQQISSLNDIFSAEVITDQRFLQSLPENIHGPTLLPQAIKNAFYDEGGNLRADRQRRGSLTMFSQGSHDNPDETLSELNTIVSPEASRIIAASVADNVLKKTPQERLEILRGLNAKIQVPAFRSTVNTPLINEKYVGIPTEQAYTIDFDNSGKFFISEDSGERQELEAFYQKKLEAFVKKLGVRSLNPKQREDLKSYFLTIQQTLGQEILRSLQRR